MSTAGLRAYTRSDGRLYRPSAAPPPSVVILCHGLGVVREIRNDAYAERFSVAPAKATSRHARRPPRAHIVVARAGHFDLYTVMSSSA